MKRPSRSYESTGTTLSPAPDISFSSHGSRLHVKVKSRTWIIMCIWWILVFLIQKITLICYISRLHSILHPLTSQVFEARFTLPVIKLNIRKLVGQKQIVFMLLRSWVDLSSRQVEVRWRWRRLWRQVKYEKTVIQPFCVQQIWCNRGYIFLQDF